MPRGMRTSALRGIASATCPRCERATDEKDYRYQKDGRCHRLCRKCEDWKRIAKRVERKQQRDAQRAWKEHIWDRIMEE